MCVCVACEALHCACSPCLCCKVPVSSFAGVGDHRGNARPTQRRSTSLFASRTSTQMQKHFLNAVATHYTTHITQQLSAKLFFSCGLLKEIWIQMGESALSLQLSCIFKATWRGLPHQRGGACEDGRGGAAAEPHVEPKTIGALQSNPSENSYGSGLQIHNYINFRRRANKLLFKKSRRS